jgi:hypothetical protein
MVSSCAGLVTIDSNIIRLVHYTTQEYFQRRGLKAFEDVQRDVIATSCLTYLSYDVFADGWLIEWDLESRLWQNAFFKYAAQNWGYHIQDAKQSAIDLALEFLMDDRKVSTSSQALFAYLWVFPPRPQQFCGMHLVAYFGLNNIMMRLLEKKDPDTRDTNGRTPLSYAAERGNALVVDLLLKYDVDLNISCHGGCTPLSLAIKGGNATIVQLLLAQKAKINYHYEIVSISTSE